MSDQRGRLLARLVRILLECILFDWASIFLAQRNAERVQEEIEGREQDRAQHEIVIKIKDEKYNQQVDKMTEQKEVWERDRQEYEKRQLEIRIGPFTIHVEL